MFKNLYIRIVLTYISAVFVGLGASIPITYYVYKEQMLRFLQSSEDILQLRAALIMMLCLALVIGSLKFIILTFFLVKPLEALTEATQKVAKGDYNIRLQREGNDELGVLSQQFQHMANELNQVEQMRQEFVSNVSHEIQTPLASISGFISILQTDGLSEQEQLRCMEIIRQESMRLSRLSDNMLRLAVLDSKYHPFHPALVQLDRQLRHIVVAAEPQWTAKKLQIRLDLPKTAVMADEDLLNQVWQNIFHNSIKFTPEGGDISIEVRPRGGEVTVTFRDNGIGIAEEDRKRIFERFFKGDKSRNRDAEGSGLGLAIVRRVIDLHSGRIEVDSRSGGGTAVTVILPRA
ncbi:sensor histidine kinase [Paenibacillus allorhizosphaerae]|uniref:histidine kinase n=1 Tax=Paenibacillus allorhizosphaerae TaxID=2849866 RepID=A0ABM8VRC9_9BACL|nr:HAMP domain-containing sensor histidine kinase [Paenibacillus allorhizosphaerae]CAG7655054.1 Adaptive-response sensory-kinase SasA [Paenibacillus allorhizosphaerae]